MITTVSDQVMVLVIRLEPMFSNPGTLETFSMSRTKLSYAIGHGIGPVFKEELISDVRATEPLQSSI